VRTSSSPWRRADPSPGRRPGPWTHWSRPRRWPKRRWPRPIAPRWHGRCAKRPFRCGAVWA
jgi:hypothetical protein